MLKLCYHNLVSKNKGECSKMIICYEIVCSERHIEDFGSCSVFGLRAYEEGNKCSESICCIEDISPDKKFVEALCERLRRYDVHLVHFKDIVIDAIS
ncbi:MAG: DUF6514 family protein [Candidatus Fimivivens sp.]|nr:DUF6514 family protein [Candidatus Fimivivens sp.]